MSDHPDADRFAKDWGGWKYTLEQTGNVGYAFEPEALLKLQHFIDEQNELIREMLTREYERELEDVC